MVLDPAVKPAIRILFGSQDEPWGDSELMRQMVGQPVDCTGSALVVAQMLELQWLLPGLPEPGRGWLISLLSLLSPESQLRLLDPSLVILPAEQWPLEVPKARVMAFGPEWERVCRHMYDARLWEPISYDAIFKVNGVPVLAGVMGVDKGWGEAFQRRAQRLITNLVPANSYQARISEAAVDLPYVTQLGQLVLPARELGQLYSGDQASFFHQHSLPDCWWPLMALGRPVQAWVLGLTTVNELIWLSVRVVPMG
jgi:hypothetical protein